MNRLASIGVQFLLLCAVSSSHAQSLVFSGRLDDPANPALAGSDLGAPSFIDARDIANNVALYPLDVLSAGPVTILSTGFAAGGVDPYFSLFKGAGATATWLDSNYLQAFSTGGDFSFSAVLAAGAYQIALGAFANLSSAENLGTGSLANGFTAIGLPSALGDGSYRLQISAPVPEPKGWMLALSGLLLVWAWQRKRHVGSGATQPTFRRVGLGDGRTRETHRTLV